MRIGPSLYTSALKQIRSCSWLCDFSVIPSSRHSWTLFIRLSLTVPLLWSCCISYSIDALMRYSACGLIRFSIDSLFLAPASFGPTSVFFFLYLIILWRGFHLGFRPGLIPLLILRFELCVKVSPLRFPLTTVCEVADSIVCQVTILPSFNSLWGLVATFAGVGLAVAILAGRGGEGALVLSIVWKITVLPSNNNLLFWLISSFLKS